MSDDASVQDGGDPAASDPAGPVDEGSSSDIDLAQVAADFDQEALETLDFGAPPASKEEGQPERRQADKPPADALDDFIQTRYQGNRAAAVAALYESGAEAKRLAEEVRSLRSRIDAPPPPDPAAELKALREQDSEFQSLNQEIQAIDADNKSVGQRQLEIAREAGSLATEIAKLEGQLLNPNADNQAQLYADLSSRRADLRSLQTEFNTNDRVQRTFQLSRRNLERQLTGIEDSHRNALANREYESRQNQQIAVRTRTNFETAFTQNMKTFGIEPNTPQFRVLHEVARTQLADYLDSLGDADGLDGPGMVDAVGRLLKSLTEAFPIAKKAAARSLAPRPIVRSPAIPSRSPAGPPVARTSQNPNPRVATTDDIFDDPDLIRQRAARIIAAAQKPRRGGPFA